MMNNIKWKDGAVCFAGNSQWNFIPDNIRIIGFENFQLNEIRQGDYIEAPELDIEQKYNDAVEVFELFGFSPYLNCDMDKSEFIKQALNYGEGLIADDELDLVIDYNDVNDISQKIRKITYPQLMAIGKLKRAMIDKVDAQLIEISNSSELPNSSDAVNKPSHYQFFEGIEVIEIIASSMTREQFKGYCLGNRIKYRLRAGNKDDVSQEIAKSDKYVELYDEHKHLCK